MEETLSTDTGQNKKINKQAGYRITCAGMAVNVVLVIFKLWAGFTSRSQALIADSVHSIADLLSDLIVLLGLKYGRREADEEHPYGHARIETVASMFIGILLIAAAFDIGYNAVTAIYEHRQSQPSLLTVAVVIFSILSKEVMFWYTLTVGRHIKSQAVIANAWHHRSDALSSVAVLIGVGATYLHPGFRLADSFAALVVTYFIARVGAGLAWSAYKEIVDTAPDNRILRQITEAAAGIEGVRQVHDLLARHSGSQILAELHIVVNPDLTVRQGHAIARRVKRQILENVEGVSRVILHVDPDLKP